jgi:putative transcriptional regulator
MLGGPVSPQTGWIVFDAPQQAAQEREDVLMVTESLGVSASKQFLVDAVRGEGPARAMLVQGYAGWGPGQLELELRQGVWIPVDLDARVIFDEPPERRWSAALGVLGIHPASLPRTQIAQA